RAEDAVGDLLAAALLVGLDAGARGGVAAALIGLLAIFVGRFPGGPYEALRLAAERLRPRHEVTLTPLGAGVRRRLRATLTGPGTRPHVMAAAGATAVTVPYAGADAGTGTGTGTGTRLTGGRPLVTRPVPRPAPATGEPGPSWPSDTTDHAAGPSTTDPGAPSTPGENRADGPARTAAVPEAKGASPAENRNRPDTPKPGGPPGPRTNGGELDVPGPPDRAGQSHSAPTPGASPAENLGEPTSPGSGPPPGPLRAGGGPGAAKPTPDR
ncbi:hypothetical protein O3Q52_53700, partial [Streptomyces sp. ActVer]|nr:hypothetical protein [Streptomyces sp. ActVer]